MPSIQNALDKSGKDLKLVEGKGNEKDTLGKKIVYVMDTNTFPFRQAELYHQFHDGFMPGEQYGRQYHDIAKALVADGRLKVIVGREGKEGNKSLIALYYIVLHHIIHCVA